MFRDSTKQIKGIGLINGLRYIKHNADKLTLIFPISPQHTVTDASKMLLKRFKWQMSAFLKTT